MQSLVRDHPARIGWSRNGGIRNAVVPGNLVVAGYDRGLKRRWIDSATIDVARDAVVARLLLIVERRWSLDRFDLRFLIQFAIRVAGDSIRIVLGDLSSRLTIAVVLHDVDDGRDSHHQKASGCGQPDDQSDLA